MSNILDPQARVLRLAKKQGILRAKDLTDRDIPRIYLSRLVAQGKLVKLERGLYALTQHNPGEQHALALVAKRVPEGVVCLLSALQFHGLTTQSPWAVWLGIEYGGRTPKLQYPPLHVVRYNHESFCAGVEEHTVEGVAVQIFTPAKTIADCFKYRRQVGLDVALEALKSGWQDRRFKVEEVLHHARINRVEKVIRPYLEAVLA